MSDITWSRARSFDDLCAANIRFIQGQLDETPVHGGPLDPESMPLVDTMVALNRQGWLTTNSQPGELGDDFQQRAWVEGYATETMALRLAKKRLTSDVLILPFDPRRQYACPVVPITQANGYPYTCTGEPAWDEDIEHFAAVCDPRAAEAVRRAWYVIAVDLVWGRKDRLWEVLLAAEPDGILVEPHPDLGLGHNEPWV